MAGRTLRALITSPLLFAGTTPLLAQTETKAKEEDLIFNHEAQLCPEKLSPQHPALPPDAPGFRCFGDLEANGYAASAEPDPTSLRGRRGIRA